jgi:hypothetical protein
VDDAGRRRPASSNLGRMLRRGQLTSNHCSHQRTASPWRLAVNNAIWIASLATVPCLDNTNGNWREKMPWHQA